MNRKLLITLTFAATWIAVIASIIYILFWTNSPTNYFDVTVYDIDTKELHHVPITSETVVTDLKYGSRYYNGLFYTGDTVIIDKSNQNVMFDAVEKHFKREDAIGATIYFGVIALFIGTILATVIWNYDEYD